MVDRAEAAGVTVDRHVVGRVGEDHRGALFAEKGRERLAIESIAAQDAMATDPP